MSQKSQKVNKESPLWHQVPKNPKGSGGRAKCFRGEGIEAETLPKRTGKFMNGNSERMMTVYLGPKGKDNDRWHGTQRGFTGRDDREIRGKEKEDAPNNFLIGQKAKEQRCDYLHGQYSDLFARKAGNPPSDASSLAS